MKPTITDSSRNQQEAADRMIEEGALAGGAEAVLLDEVTPIYCDKNRWHDSVQTVATSVFALFPDRVEWRVHAAPDERDTLSGTMRDTPCDGVAREREAFDSPNWYLSVAS